MVPMKINSSEPPFPMLINATFQWQEKMPSLRQALNLEYYKDLAPTYFS